MPSVKLIGWANRTGLVALLYYPGDLVEFQDKNFSNCGVI